MKHFSDPEGDRSSSCLILKGIIWTALVLSDLVIGVSLAGLGFPMPDLAVFLVTFLSLFCVELWLWSTVDRLFC